MPIGDVQWGSEGCDLNKLKDYIAMGLEQDAWFLGMGDMHDVMSPSNRKKLATASLYDNAMDWMEDKMAHDIEFLYEEVFKPTKGRWLGMLEGHHFWEFSDGSTTDTELCRRLEAPFLGSCGFLRLQFVQEKEHGNRSISCDLWAHHGTGGGSTVGAVLNKLERVAGSFDADIYLMGHANRLGAVPKPLLQLGGNPRGGKPYLKNKERYLVATGAFDRGYMVGSTAGRTGRPRGGYVEQGMMLPTGLGAALVKVEPRVHYQAGIPDYCELAISVTV